MYMRHSVEVVLEFYWNSQWVPINCDMNCKLAPLWNKKFWVLTMKICLLIRTPSILRYFLLQDVNVIYRTPHINNAHWNYSSIDLINVKWARHFEHLDLYDYYKWFIVRRLKWKIISSNNNVSFRSKMVLDIFRLAFPSIGRCKANSSGTKVIRTVPYQCAMSLKCHIECNRKKCFHHVRHSSRHSFNIKKIATA